MSGWGPTIVSIVTMIFVAGMTYGRIRGQEVTLERHNNELKDHGVRIDTLETEAEKTKAWHEGFTAGVAKHKTQI